MQYWADFGGPTEGDGKRRIGKLGTNFFQKVQGGKRGPENAGPQKM